MFTLCIVSSVFHVYMLFCSFNKGVYMCCCLFMLIFYFQVNVPFCVILFLFFFVSGVSYFHCIVSLYHVSFRGCVVEFLCFIGVWLCGVVLSFSVTGSSCSS